MDERTGFDKTVDTFDKAVNEATSFARDTVDEAADAMSSEVGWPDRKYSFNALIAVGVVGYLVGRMIGR